MTFDPDDISDITNSLKRFYTLVRDLLKKYHSSITLIHLAHQALVACKTATQVDLHTTLQPLLKKETIPPGKSADHQWRLKTTVKCPERKKSGIILT